MDVKNFIESPDPLPQDPKIELTLTVNDVHHQLQVAPAARLIDLLREDLGLTGTKMSCEIGRCGACAVQMNGKLVNSCLIMAYQAINKYISTIEGLAEDHIHPIQRAFLEEGGFQCGYCTPGMIMAVKALLDEFPQPTQAQIQEALSGNLCRCTGYGGIIRAVEKAISTLTEKESHSALDLSIQRVNQMEKDVFVRTIGWVFEHSPWVAEKAWESLPFKSRKHLYQTMVKIVENAEESLQLALLRAHPDLGTRLKMSDVSQKEQAGVGLDRLSKEEHAEFVSLNQRYVKKFGFPFIMAVKGQNKDTILSAMKERVDYSYEAECMTALNEVYKIAGFRLNDTINKGDDSMKRTMCYGKEAVWVYRTYAKPLTEIRSIPESAFTGRRNILFGINVKVAVEGDAFLSSFKDGDNTLVVATDSMKNFILKHAGDYDGATLEGFLEFVARRFLEKYPQMTCIKIFGEQIPFDELPVPTKEGFEPSPLVFRYSLNEQPCAAIEVKHTSDGFSTTDHLCSLKDLKLIKVRGSSFFGYVKDEYTTLLESYDRPLFIFLTIEWRYNDMEGARGNTPEGYVAAEQVRDIAYTVFHEANSPSIQNLIYRIGQRILERFPQLVEVRFESNNRTWETVLDEIPASDEGKVFTEPRPPFGFQRFSMTREDLVNTEELEE